MFLRQLVPGVTEGAAPAPTAAPRLGGTGQATYGPQRLATNAAMKTSAPHLPRFHGSLEPCSPITCPPDQVAI